MYRRALLLSVGAFLIAAACGSADTTPTTSSPQITAEAPATPPTTPVPPTTAVPPVTSAPTTTGAPAMTVTPTTTVTLDAVALLDAVNEAMAGLDWIGVSFEERLATPDRVPIRTVTWEGSGRADGGDEPDSQFWAFGTTTDHTASPVRVDPWDYREVDHVAYRFAAPEWEIDTEHEHSGSFSAALRGRLTLDDLQVSEDVIDGEQMYVFTGTFVEAGGTVEEVTLWTGKDDALISRFQLEASIPVPEFLVDSVPAGIQMLEKMVDSELMLAAAPFGVVAPPLGVEFGYAPGAVVPVLMQIPLSGWRQIVSMDDQAASEAAGVFVFHTQVEDLNIGAVTLLRHDSGLELALIDECCPANLAEYVDGFYGSLDAAAIFMGALVGDPPSHLTGGQVREGELFNENLQGASMDVRVYEVGFFWAGIEEPEVVHVILSYVAEDGSAFMAGFFATNDEAIAGLVDMLDLVIFVLDTFRILEPETHSAIVQSAIQ